MGDLKRDLNRFKKLHEKAVKEGRSQFTFQGQAVLTKFAKYYIEYLTGVIDRRKNETISS